MSPAYRHANPPPIPDGDTVPQPAPEPAPPATIADRWWAVLFVALTIGAMILGTVLQ